MDEEVRNRLSYQLVVAGDAIRSGENLELLARLFHLLFQSLTDPHLDDRLACHSQPFCLPISLLKAGSCADRLQGCRLFCSRHLCNWALEQGPLPHGHGSVNWRFPRNLTSDANSLSRMTRLAAVAWSGHLSVLGACFGRLARNRPVLQGRVSG